MESHYTVLSEDSGSDARRGRLKTLHGTIETPIFMPVGTQGTVKGLMPEQLKSVGAQIILGNTYHLNLRPTSEHISQMGGLHRFMRWDGPILTDSGGFQVFSLSKLRKIREDGIHFQSHLDGSKVILTPERVIDIQRNLGSDIAMVLDECPSAEADAQICEQAVERTLRWAAEARDYVEQTGFLAAGHHVFGIVQGSRFMELRKRCAEELVAMNFPGYAIGGVSVGEPEEEMLPQVSFCTDLLPRNKPRYVMGVGTPPQLLKMIAAGADMFDCVMPTREARHGIAFTEKGKINLKNAKYKLDERPLFDEFTNNEIGKFSRAYIRHLIISGEILGGVLLTLHNVRFYLHLMSLARQHIENNTFAAWHRDWIDRYTAGTQGNADSQK